MHSSRKPIGLSVALLLGCFDVRCAGSRSAEAQPGPDRTGAPSLKKRDQGQRRHALCNVQRHHAVQRPLHHQRDCPHPAGWLDHNAAHQRPSADADERKKDNEKLEKFANDPDARRKRREANKAEDKRAETHVDQPSRRFPLHLCRHRSRPQGRGTRPFEVQDRTPISILQTMKPRSIRACRAI